MASLTDKHLQALILHCLREMKEVTALQIARKLVEQKQSTTNIPLTKKRVNSILYELERQNRVCHTPGSPPVWRALGKEEKGEALEGRNEGKEAAESPPILAHNRLNANSDGFHCTSTLSTAMDATEDACSSGEINALIGVDLDAITQQSKRLALLSQRPDVLCIGWQGPATNLPFQQWYPSMQVCRTSSMFNDAADFALAMDMALRVEELLRHRSSSCGILRVYVVSKDRSVANIVHWFNEQRPRDNVRASMVTTPEAITF